jgi:hypothetical protein
VRGQLQSGGGVTVTVPFAREIARDQLAQALARAAA